ncbi:MAG: CvpA family protein [Clostridiales bacterium]|nr:CvpA family protein [Clostridiales bacterium]
MIIDIILILIILLGAFLGYKKGLINEVFGIIGIFLAIILAMLSYKTIVRNIIPKTGLDKTVYTIVEQKFKDTENALDTSINIPENLQTYFDANVIINQTSSNNIEKTSNFIVNAITIVLLIIIYYIIIMIIKMLLNKVADLPILSSINGIGGAVVGIVKNMIIVLIILTLLSFYSTIGKANFITQNINNSIITKQIYDSNFITTIFINAQNTNDENI